jgi:Fe-S-cluster containining protein
MTDNVFYGKGLRFGCTRCSRCCRHTPGFVFLSERDVQILCGSLGIARGEFIRAYCRRVATGIAERISLREKKNLDCVFWEKDGCSVYDARPLQCRSFPFWGSNLSNRSEWETVARECPGIGGGMLHGRDEIEEWLVQREDEGLLEG